MLVNGLGESINHESQYDYSQKLHVQRAVMGTTLAEHTVAAAPIVYVVSPKFKFPSGSKGKNLNLRLLKQYGYVDSIGITYKGKKIK